jgi:uncharacterized protein (TIGR03382 family)
MRGLALALALVAVGSSAQAQPFRIFGQVTLSDGADPTGTNVHLGGPSPADTTTDANGSYSFDGLDPGSYSVAASRDNYRAQSMDNVAVSADTEVDFALTRVYRLSGSAVLADGRGPPAGTLVTATGPEGDRTDVTDTMGAFSIENLVAGSYSVSATRDCYQADVKQLALADDASLAFSLSPNRFTMRGSVLLAGGVTDESGTAVTLSQGGGLIASGTTDVTGAYGFLGICPGDYALSATHPGYQPGAAQVSLAADTQVPALTLSAGPRFSVRGTVVAQVPDPTSGAPRWQPASGVDVFVAESNLHAALTGADGKYRIDGIAPGSYTLVAQKQGFAAARVPNLPISADVDLDVQLAPPTPVVRESAGCSCSAPLGAPGALALAVCAGLLFWRRRRRAR